jgi:hypothetical protein
MALGDAQVPWAPDAWGHLNIVHRSGEVSSTRIRYSDFTNIVDAMADGNLQQFNVSDRESVLVIRVASIGAIEWRFIAGS